MFSELVLGFLAFRFYSYLCIKSVNLIPAFIRNAEGWKKKDTPFLKVKHVSHRGGAGENVEHTLDAFRHSLEEANADVLELDVHMTKDKVLVVSHDSNLRHLCGKDVDVSSVDFNELPCISQSLQVASEPPGVVIENPRYPDSKIVRLEQVFQEFPEAKFNIDLKSGTTEMADRLAEMIEERNLKENVIWGSDANSQMSRYLREKYGHIGQFCTEKSVIRIVVLYWLGLLPFVTLDESVYEPPLPQYFLLGRRKSTDTITWKEWVVFRVLDFLFMQGDLFKHLSDRNIPTWIWTINDDSQFEYAFKKGVSAVMTDYPTKLRRYLDAKRSD